MIASEEKKFYLDLRKQDLEMVKFYYGLYKERGEERLLKQAEMFAEWAEMWRKKAEELSTG